MEVKLEGNLTGAQRRNFYGKTLDVSGLCNGVFTDRLREMFEVKIKEYRCEMFYVFL